MKMTTKVTITFELLTRLNDLEIEDLVNELTDDYNTDVTLEQSEVL